MTGNLPQSADIQDRDGQEGYRRLVDALLWSALELSVFSRLPQGFSFLDVGGGAGPWTQRIAAQYPDSSGVVTAASSSAREFASERAARQGYAHRVRHLVGDTENTAELLPGQRFDLILAVDQRLGLAADPEHAVGSLGRLLATGGVLVSFLPSRWHAASVDLAAGDAERARQSLAGGGARTAGGAAYGPLFTPGEIRALHVAAGLNVDLVTGFPSLICAAPAEPGSGRAATAEGRLREEVFFRQVLSMERELLIDPDAGGRGAHLLAVASRR
jgi:SAM-dependent methyltransferase